jgi:glycosyltransferase involved in cell wall biosynthesis
LIPVKNKQKLQEAMLDLIQDPERRQVFAENGKHWAQNFDRELIWEGMDNIYKQ